MIDVLLAALLGVVVGVVAALLVMRARRRWLITPECIRLVYTGESFLLVCPNEDVGLAISRDTSCQIARDVLRLTGRGES